MSDLQKGRVFQGKYGDKLLVKILDVISGENGNPDIVLFREVHPDVLAHPTGNWTDLILDFEFKKGSNKRYELKNIFENDFVWFILDEETMAKIRMGYYE